VNLPEDWFRKWARTGARWARFTGTRWRAPIRVRRDGEEVAGRLDAGEIVQGRHRVVDVSSFGGPTKEYQIRLDPGKLVAYGLSISQVEQQVPTTIPMVAAALLKKARNRSTCSRWTYSSVQDIENTLSRMRTAPRSRSRTLRPSRRAEDSTGQIGRATIARRTIVDNPDTVEGIVLLQKGDDSDPVLLGSTTRCRN